MLCIIHCSIFLYSSLDLCYIVSILYCQYIALCVQSDALWPNLLPWSNDFRYKIHKVNSICIYVHGKLRLSILMPVSNKIFTQNRTWRRSVLDFLKCFSDGQSFILIWKMKNIGKMLKKWCSLFAFIVALSVVKGFEILSTMKTAFITRLFVQSS